ncbi:MAG: N-acetylmuramoyl-L-alanine amidase [Cytophagales bacterium]|nr:N-acetylmuramoyl-L-alanine amidase [Cytophagales bacterium]
MRNIVILLGISVFFLFSFHATGPVSYSVKRIVIDAGHGKHDPGTSGKFSKEKDVALKIALELGRVLKENLSDVEVIFTRDDDTFLELYERAELANEKGADLFISIHCNAFNNKEIYGSESYVMGLDKVNKNLATAKRENSVILLEDDQTKYEGFDPESDESYILFNLYQSAHLNNSLLLASEIERQMKDRVGRNSRGVRQAPFWVLWQTTMPSVLVETGYLSNAKEEQELNDKLNQVYIASGIYRAVRSYKEKMEASN